MLDSDAPTQILLDPRDPHGSTCPTDLRGGGGSADHHQRALRTDEHQEGGCYFYATVYELDQLLQGPVYPMPAERSPGKASKGEIIVRTVLTWHNNGIHLPGVGQKNHTNRFPGASLDSKGLVQEI